MTQFCADIHNNLAITLTSTGVKAGACCWDNTQIEVSDTQKLWTADNLIRLRELNKQNQLDRVACKKCIYMETHGGISRRLGVNEYYNSTATDLLGPRGLEIKIDYTCNLACVYCGPYNSTQWRLELNTPKTTYPIRLAQPEIIKILDALDLSDLNNIHFYGGDPLFTNTHEVILNYIDQKVGLKDIYVWYHTNGTIRVNEQVKELWSRCKLIKLFFSIDDIGLRFNYIRYGADWKEVEENLFWYRETMPSNVMFTLECTMSCLNALHHYEFMQWKSRFFNTNREGDFTDVSRHYVFDNFELNSMPDELMKKCLELNSQDSWYQEFVKSFKYNYYQHFNTKRLIKTLDARRGCSFKDTFPDLVPYFM